jgi:putative spermidine/putrescine transport system ATP-binding protein
LNAGSFLQLESLTRAFDGVAAVRELSFGVGEHEILTLLGPSGCGKTTTLRMIAGFERPDAGRIVLDGRDVTPLAPQNRGFGMVFQHYALFPHLSVGGNVAFGLESAGLGKSEIAERVARALGLVGLPGTQDRSVGSLSGGQQQRVALARALAPEPKVLLLDEPLSNLDATLRERTRRELRTLVKQIGITTVYVTHDQEEAFDLSDRIAVMAAGNLEQLGPAEVLYQRPATEFVATFLGRASEVEATLQAAEGTVATCRLAGDVVWRALYTGKIGPPGEGAPLRLLARPEALEFTSPSGAGALRGTVRGRRFAGSVYAFTVEVEGGWLEVQTSEDVVRKGAEVGVAPRAAPSGLFAFPSTDAGAE